MYLVQELLRVPNTRQSELVQHLASVHEHLKSRPGFLGAQIARYLGSPSQYLTLQLWRDPDAYEAALSSIEAVSKQRPDGLYENENCGRTWEQVIDSPGDTLGSYLVRSTYRVNDGRWEEYIDNRRRHDGLGLQVPGMTYFQTYRCVDAGNEHKDEAMVLARRLDRDTYNRYLESSQSAEYRKGNPRGLYSTLATECYEVVAEITPEK